MQPFIMFEGIASSGKTTLERMLHAQLKDSVIVSEGRTLMPLIENKDPEKAHEHLSTVLDEIEKQPAKTFIVDRFHLTHAFRTGVPLSSFDDIEERLSKEYQPLIVLLQMDEEVISHGIGETAALRGASWAKGKQGSLEEKIAYYKDQQRTLIKLLDQSRLPSLMIDTTDKNWSLCVALILERLTALSQK